MFRAEGFDTNKKHPQLFSGFPIGAKKSKKMKDFIISLVTITSLFCTQQSSGYYCSEKLKEHTIDSIVIYKAEVGIEMSSAICCEEIFKHFIIEKQVIQDKDSIATIVSGLERASIIKDWDTCVDTRAVIKIYSKSRTIETACIGQLSIIKINNEIVELNDRHLINYIFNLKN